jgi:Protein of unknown function (DUF2637)
MGGRWTYRISAAGVLLLAAAAFTLSYDALHQLALDSRVRPGLAWMWPVVIDGTIVVALLTVLAAKRATARTGYPWALAGLFSLASVAFNIAHAPNRPIAQLVFAMAPVALVLTTHLLMQQASWRHPIAGLAAAEVEEAGPQPAHPHSPGDPPHTARPVWTAQGRLAPAHGFGRHTKPSWRPGRPPPGPASPERPASASATGNACSPSSPPTRHTLVSQTATRRGERHEETTGPNDDRRAGG